MGRQSSWSCDGCTNICYRATPNGVFRYCRMVIEHGGQKVEWQGDHVACLDYTNDPEQTDDMVRIHEEFI